MKNLKKKIGLCILLLFVISLSVLLYFISPSKIVNFIGIENSYVLVFILGILGGVSILFPFPYYLFVLTFAAGGSNPILLGIFTGLGVIIGESTSYWIGYNGTFIFSNKFQKKLVNFSKNLNTLKNTILMSLFLFIYGVFIPIPNDVLILPLGATKYNYWKLIIPLGLGNILFNILLAYGGIQGWSFFGIR
ncbi:MAG: VTT domain-containing protein [Candidatus Pacearchaeota archaeon]|jgi:membrane protein YqaA with SNARE-associated domain